MPDHFHLIVNPRNGDIQGFCGALKSLGAKKIVELTSYDGKGWPGHYKKEPEKKHPKKKGSKCKDRKGQ